MTELRNKGETQRFLDEVGYLFEGLDPTMSLSVRRLRCVFELTIQNVLADHDHLSAIEVITKMADPEFVRKAKITDILGRTWDVLREAGAGSGDPVLDMCIAAFAAYIAHHDPRAISDISAAKSDCDVVLSNTLEREIELEPWLFLEEGHDADDAKRAGVSKAEKKNASD